MQCSHAAPSAARSCSDQLAYELSPATISDGEVTVPVHLIAARQGAAITYGRHVLAAVARVSLTVGSAVLRARVRWSDGLRTRLDTL